MLPRFRECLKFVLKWEGGFSNHPADRGGATNKGITQATYDAYRKQKGLHLRSVKFITDEEVEEIYYTKYYLPSKAHLMPPPLDVVVFDTAVNMGVKTSAILLQKALQELGYYTLAVDGIVGELTLHAVRKAQEKDALFLLIVKYVQLRIQRYRGIVAKNPSQRVFLKGWLNRALDLLNYCKKWGAQVGA